LRFQAVMPRIAQAPALVLELEASRKAKLRRAKMSNLEDKSIELSAGLAVASDSMCDPDPQAPGLAAVMCGPSVAGDLPGPRSQELLLRQARWESNARTYPRRLPIAIARASGSFVQDLDGNVFIDFLTGAGVLSLGHNHPELVAVARRQLATHTHGLDFPTPAKDAFIQAQLSMLPETMRSRVKLHFCGPAGANAVDAAIKLCKIATGRGEIIAFQGGFHGSSHMAMAMTGLVEQKAPVPNGVPGVHFFPYSYCSRCPVGLEPDSCAVNCVGYLERSLLDSNGGIPLPAAIMLELVQGEGGVIPARAEFALRVAALARRLGVPLIVDEVQTGGGRTGTWFAFEQYDLEPDVIVASKALSGIGMPVAVIMYDQRLDRWAPGAHTGTFRGNQLAFATGAEAIRIIRRDDILGNVRERAAQVADRLSVLLDLCCVKDIRGRGLMWGIELANPDDDLPAGDLAHAVQANCLRRGLILECGGRDDCVIRMLPPLNVTADVLDTACSILIDAIGEAAARRPAEAV
jgi:diaminobutyrate-2-oxoglutarate transaminase